MTPRQKHEAQRQARDRNRVRNAQAYRYIAGEWHRTGSVPDNHRLTLWLEDMGYSVRAPKLIEDMIKKGWLAAHGNGYKLITQTSPERLIPALIEAHEKHDEQLFSELADLWRREQGTKA